MSPLIPSPAPNLPTNQLASINSPILPALVAAAGERASMRFLEYFAANIRNPHIRRIYARAAEEFLAWCAAAGVPSIAAVQPVHVATWIEAGAREVAAPSVKQRLAAIRHLFDWLVTGQVVPVNSAVSVCGPRHVVTRVVPERSIATLKVSSWRLIASGPFDLSGPRATTRTVTGGIGFSPGTRNSVPALSMSA